MRRAGRFYLLTKAALHRRALLAEQHARKALAVADRAYLGQDVTSAQLSDTRGAAFSEEIAP
jgi:ABC-type branched-subunit amino acid transport system ATPase component